ncbi:hypothetical protein JKP88DRAFT_266359 [Tribonema minus]|uniref:Uncharacterized protein n=1 Tax=Tribonema minus TaxID=303371 RepID=A0A835ZE84_9STRA|nr:hypothetical protein JKP88DRAFT_266359 [Tribonema minus]
MEAAPAGTIFAYACSVDAQHSRSHNEHRQQHAAFCHKRDYVTATEFHIRKTLSSYGADGGGGASLKDKRAARTALLLSYGAKHAQYIEKKGLLGLDAPAANSWAALIAAAQAKAKRGACVQVAGTLKHMRASSDGVSEESKPWDRDVWAGAHTREQRRAAVRQRATDENEWLHDMSQGDNADGLNDSPLLKRSCRGVSRPSSTTATRPSTAPPRRKHEQPGKAQAQQKLQQTNTPRQKPSLRRSATMANADNGDAWDGDCHSLTRLGVMESVQDQHIWPYICSITYNAAAATYGCRQSALHGGDDCGRASRVEVDAVPSVAAAAVAAEAWEVQSGSNGGNFKVQEVEPSPLLATMVRPSCASQKRRALLQSTTTERLRRARVQERQRLQLQRSMLLASALALRTHFMARRSEAHWQFAVIKAMRFKREQAAYRIQTLWRKQLCELLHDLWSLFSSTSLALRFCGMRSAQQLEPEVAKRLQELRRIQAADCVRDFCHRIGKAIRYKARINRFRTLVVRSQRYVKDYLACKAARLELLRLLWWRIERAAIIAARVRQQQQQQLQQGHAVPQSQQQQQQQALVILKMARISIRRVFSVYTAYIALKCTFVATLLSPVMAGVLSTGAPPGSPLAAAAGFRKKRPPSLQRMNRQASFLSIGSPRRQPSLLEDDEEEEQRARVLEAGHLQHLRQLQMLRLQQRRGFRAILPPPPAAEQPEEEGAKNKAFVAALGVLRAKRVLLALGAEMGDNHGTKYMTSQESHLREILRSHRLDSINTAHMKDMVAVTQPLLTAQDAKRMLTCSTPDQLRSFAGAGSTSTPAGPHGAGASGAGTAPVLCYQRFALDFLKLEGDIREAMVLEAQAAVAAASAEAEAKAKAAAARLAAALVDKTNKRLTPTRRPANITHRLSSTSEHSEVMRPRRLATSSTVIQSVTQSAVGQANGGRTVLSRAASARNVGYLVGCIVHYTLERASGNQIRYDIRADRQDRQRRRQQHAGEGEGTTQRRPPPKE